VILAGYADRMDTFFQSNPGMNSRIAHHLAFPDYSAEELLEISQRMLDAAQYRFGEGARTAFADYLARRVRQPHFANARSVRNALDRARLRQASAASAAGLQLAIATTTSPVNIASLLRRAIGPDWRLHFAVVEDASTAPRKKPDPMVYRQTLARLGLAASDCLALEDSANGLKSATQAGLRTVITTNDFTAHHDFAGALRVLPSLEGVGLAQLREWHASA